MGEVVLTMKQNKVSGVYKITNNITNECYVGSSKDIMKRWTCHKAPSTWALRPGMKLYQAFIKYGLDNFKFEILEETAELKDREQYWIDQLKANYNNYQANGQNTKRYIEYGKEWYKSHHDKCLAQAKEWQDAHYDSHLAIVKKYRNKICLYKGEKLTLNALSARFRKQGIAHSTQEAKKYLLME